MTGDPRSFVHCPACNRTLWCDGPWCWHCGEVLPGHRLSAWERRFTRWINRLLRRPA